MSSKLLLGELHPVGGGDVIPLTEPKVLVGRRSHCDVQLASSSVSSQHCELEFRDGYWHIRDLGSSNGTFVNGEMVDVSPVMPGDEILFAKLAFQLQYHVPEDAPPPEQEDPLSMSLMEKAGLEAQRIAERKQKAEAAKQSTMAQRGPQFSSRDQFLIDWLPEA